MAFWRAPYLGGRVALAAVRALGVAYAVLSAAALGFVLPDLLGVVAPGARSLPLVEAVLLPALAALTVGRILFQDVPTRGATAFLLLPVSRARIAGGVLLRSLASPFSVVPMAFVLPFAVRTVSAEASPEVAAVFVLAAGALVALSHGILVIWKTRLGSRPAWTLAVVLGAAGAVAGLEAWHGGLLAHVRGGGAASLVALLVLTGAVLALAYRSLVAALYLEGTGAGPSRSGGAARGFRRPGLLAFVDLDLRMIARTPFPRGIMINAFAVGLAITAGAIALRDVVPTELALVFSAGPVAGSFGQFAVPFASGYYDRLLTLPGATRQLVHAKMALIVAGTLLLGACQIALVLVIAPGYVWFVAASVLFSLGVLAPAAMWGSTLGPKPLDISERLMFNYKAQSFGAQALVAATAVGAGLALQLGGPALGGAIASGAGAAGLLAAPLWMGALARRLRRRRHALAARFRTDL